MLPYQIIDRLNLLYGTTRPMISEVEKVVNTEELSSIFALSSYFLGKKHRANINALMNLVYERQNDENIFVLFKVLNRIVHDNDSLDALRNFMAVDKVDRKNMYLVFKVLDTMYPDETDVITDLKNVICAEDGEFSREQIFILFNVLQNKIIGDDKYEDVNLSALKNVCANKDYVSCQTELLFRLLINLDNKDEEILDAIKNIISVEKEVDLFLLFKVIQALDEDNDNIALIKTATIFKSKIFDLVNELTDYKFDLPNNMKKMCMRFEGDALTDAFSRGQLKSKLWLIEELENNNIKLGDVIYVCAGWYGVLPALLFERCDIPGHIYSFDIDETTDLPAITLNKEQIIENKFKAFVKDIKTLKYDREELPRKRYKYIDELNYEVIESKHEVEKPTCVINTSCEHIADFDTWWNSIPKGTLVILQNNDFIEHEDETVVNTITDVDDWASKLKLSKQIFTGTLSLEHYNRFMIIGEK
tara:strand:+ start:3954 stop:5378 length:1425 start_codon:yes stop_codon:yes gene_type:complete